MKLISWNIAGRVSTVDDQIDYLLNGEFDIICLQEVIAKTEEIISENFKDNGYSVITSSIGKHRENQGKHKYNLLIISKDQIKIELPKYKIKWREKYLRGIVDCGQSKIEVTTLHIPPGSSNGWEKIITIEESYKNLIESKNSKRIVCGDWNTPKSESLSGEITTWGENKKRGDKNGRWDKGERLLLEELKNIGFSDTFRLVNGHEKIDYSWFVKTKNGKTGRRYDHIYSTDTISVKDCFYDHSVRVGKLSDHSAIITEFER